MENKIETFVIHVFVMAFMTVQRFSPIYNLFFY